MSLVKSAKYRGIFIFLGILLVAPCVYFSNSVFAQTVGSNRVPDFSQCAPIANGSDISSSSCVKDGDKYIQYQVTLKTTDGVTTPVFQDISINYAGSSTSLWSQTTWEGGYLQDNWKDNTRFFSQSSIKTTIPGEISLPVSNQFTNGSFESGVDGWGDIPVAVAMQPDSISDLVLWLKADAITGLNDGDTVTTWPDTSGKGYNAAQATVGYKPIFKTSILNSNPIVRFDGTDDVMTVVNPTENLANDLSIFYIFNPTNLGARRNPFDKSYGGEFAFTVEPSGQLSYYHGQSTASGSYIGWDALKGTTITNNSWQFFSMVRDNTSKTIDSYLGFALHNSLVGYTINPSQSASSILIGDGYSYNLAGDYAEFVVFNKKLSETERLGVTTYLNQKYAIIPTVTYDTAIAYNGSSGSMKVVAVNPYALSQNIALVAGQKYMLQAYVRTDGSAVTNSDISLYASAGVIDTTYTDVGGGWYRLNGTFTAVMNSSKYGFKIEADTTINIDDISLTADGTSLSGTLMSSVYYAGGTPNWGTITYTATIPAGTSVEVRVRSIKDYGTNEVGDPLLGDSSTDINPNPGSTTFGTYSRAHTSGDFNNDGVTDFAVGQYGYSSSTGKVSIYFGQSNGALPSVESANIIGDIVWGYFGYYTVTADVNNDTIDDLIVAASAYGYNGSDISLLRGRMFVYYGGAGFPAAQPDLIIKGGADNSGGGWSVAAGDINNDGYTDILTGTTYYNFGIDAAVKGRVSVYYGPIQNDPEISWSITSGDTVSTGFGFDVLLADINGDMYDDVVYSQSNYNKAGVGRGAVHAIYGRQGNLPTTPAISILGQSATHRLGANLFNVGDVNGDGSKDLLIGSEFANSEYGILELYYGGAAMDAVPDQLYSGENDNEYYGRLAGAIGDVNHDGYDDFAISSWNAPELNRTGTVNVYLGGKNVSSKPQWRIVGESTLDRFSLPLAQRDYNRNGRNDFTVYAYGYPSGTYRGKFYLYEFPYQSPSIIANSIDLTYDTTPTMTGTASYGQRTGDVYSVDVLLNRGNDGSWDSQMAGEVTSVINDNGVYKMWYTGRDYHSYRIGHALSSNGIDWVKHPYNMCGQSGDGCVLPFSSVGGDWNDAGVNSPTVIREGGVYKMWYSGFDGANWRIGYATSPDGAAWTPYEGNNCGLTGDGCVLNIGAGGTWDDVHVDRMRVINDAGTYKMWYSGFDGSRWRIGYATSADGINWTKNPANNCALTGAGCIINVGAAGSFDVSGIYAGSVIKNGANYYLWYSGYNGTNWGIGYATSTDGIVWVKNGINAVISRSNDEISPDVQHVYLPMVIFDGTSYALWYGADRGGIVRTAYATSTDGINWTKRTVDYNGYHKNVGGVQWSLSNQASGSWHNCTASDQAFDENSEQFACEINAPSLVTGSHRIYFRSFDSSSVFANTGDYTSAVVFVDTKKIQTILAATDTTQAESIKTVLLDMNDPAAFYIQEVDKNKRMYRLANDEGIVLSDQQIQFPTLGITLTTNKDGQFQNNFAIGEYSYEYTKDGVTYVGALRVLGTASMVNNTTTTTPVPKEEKKSSLWWLWLIAASAAVGCGYVIIVKRRKKD